MRDEPAKFSPCRNSGKAPEPGGKRKAAKTASPEARRLRRDNSHQTFRPARLDPILELQPMRTRKHLPHVRKLRNRGQFPLPLQFEMVPAMSTTPGVNPAKYNFPLGKAHPTTEAPHPDASEFSYANTDDNSEAHHETRKVSSEFLCGSYLRWLLLNRNHPRRLRLAFTRTYARRCEMARHGKSFSDVGKAGRSKLRNCKNKGRPRKRISPGNLQIRGRGKRVSEMGTRLDK